MKTITLGKDQANMMNPPLEGILIENGRAWAIKQGQYGITLKDGFECHPEFINGMELVQFCWWINDKLT